MDKKLFAKLVDSMKEMNEVAAGKRKPSRTFKVDADSVKVLRAAIGLRQP
jgi:protein involved in temperature-dependent protein secretion